MDHKRVNQVGEKAQLALEIQGLFSSFDKKSFYKTVLQLFLEFSFEASVPSFLVKFAFLHCLTENFCVFFYSLTR